MSYILAPAGIAALPRSYARGVQLGLHAHLEAQLLFASRGVMQVTTSRGRWLVPPRRAVWLPPRLAHAVDMLTDVEMRSLLLSPAFVAAQPAPPPSDRPFVVAVGTLLRELVLALFAAPDDPRRVDLLGQLVLCELAEARETPTFMPLPSEPRARRVAEMILADPAGGRDLADLAAAAGASARTITRLFPAETDLTFKAWRQRARVLASIEALESRRLPVALVAARFGFASAAAYGFAFRQVLGVSPAVFARRGAVAGDAADRFAASAP
jgi:AraC-like DNA-binding protein